MLGGGPPDCPATQMTDPCDPQKGPENKGGGGRQHYRVHPSVGIPPGKRVMGPDVGMVQ